MARPRTKSKPKPKPKKPEPEIAPVVIHGSTGLEVPAVKAKKIYAAHLAGMGINEICRAYNTSHHTIAAIIANRKDLLVEVQQAAQGSAAFAEMFSDRITSPKILCAPADNSEFSGPVTENIVSDIFSYLRNADFTAQRAGIYFLFRGGSCVYVGQSKCVAGRCGQHLFYDGARFKAFDRVLYAPVAGHVITLAEAALIGALKPEYNRQRYVGGIPLAA